jgi:hypothetical protein
MQTHLRIWPASRDAIAALAEEHGRSQADIVAALVAVGQAHPEELRAALATVPRPARERSPEGTFKKSNGGP